MDGVITCGREPSDGAGKVVEVSQAVPDEEHPVPTGSARLRPGAATTGKNEQRNEGQRACSFRSHLRRGNQLCHRCDGSRETADTSRSWSRLEMLVDLAHG